MPALKPGAKGGVAGQAPPWPSQSTLRELSGVTLGRQIGALQGVMSEEEVATPQARGLASGARGPP